MASSTIPAAVDGLLAVIRAALPSVQVFDGPVIASLNFDAVIVAGSDAAEHVTGDQTTASLGAGSREESYDIEVEVVAFRGQDDQKEVRDSAFANLAAIENTLRTNKTLGGAVRLATITGGIGLDQALATRKTADGEVVPVGRRAVITAHVRCAARI